MRKIAPLFLLVVSVLGGCSGLEKSEKKRVREQNLILAPIQRLDSEHFFSLPPPTLKTRPPYPWEHKRIGSHLRITKEFFRCRGNALHPPIQVIKYGNLVYHLDCGGIEQHSLPLKEGKEYVSQILVDLLNYLQETLDKKVVITCGHRCPDHNLYADPTKKGQTSKHLVGAEVDFYVEGLERDPQVVIDALLAYFNEPLKRSNSLTEASTPSWFNQEIALTLFLKNEGRDIDNSHPYPYLSLQDRTTHYNWHTAHSGFIKY
ncbi:MAG: hypothetical protein KDK60_00425 [Chlamydiia bacterium]|nr:hypothetical protein [Chlamydiia bacterium]